MKIPAIVAIPTIAGILACSADNPNAPLGPELTGTVQLVSPLSGGRFTQNDASIGCAAHAARGFGFRTVFDWQDVEGAEKYIIRLKQAGAQFPAIDYEVSESRYERTWCNAFVIDLNLDDWNWTVAAIGPAPAGAVPDTLWSEQRVYGFDPCRLSDGRSCFAPPP
jgi:hypothetical protein